MLNNNNTFLSFTVFGNRQQKKLIALQGTIPINYRGMFANIQPEE